MTNDQFFLFPILSYGNKNTVGAVARLFFSDPPLTPHATGDLRTFFYHRQLCFCIRTLPCSGNWHLMAVRNSKGEKYQDKNSKSKEHEKTRKRKNPKRALQWRHFDHLALVSRVEEENHPCLVSFHLSHRSDVGRALAVRQVIRYKILHTTFLNS